MLYNDDEHNKSVGQLILLVQYFPKAQLAKLIYYSMTNHYSS